MRKRERSSAQTSICLPSSSNRNPRFPLREAVRGTHIAAFLQIENGTMTSQSFFGEGVRPSPYSVAWLPTRYAPCRSSLRTTGGHASIHRSEKSPIPRLTPGVKEGMDWFERMRSALRSGAKAIRLGSEVVLEVTRPLPKTPPEPSEEDWKKAREKLGAPDPFVVYIPGYFETLRTLAVNFSRRRRKAEKLRARRKRARERKKKICP